MAEAPITPRRLPAETEGRIKLLWRLTDEAV